MSRAEQNTTARPRLVPVVLGLGLVVVLAGCGAGQITQTDSQVSAVNGASGQVGQIAVRDTRLDFPDSADRYYAKGSSAPLVATVTNQNPTTDDRLVSVSSAAAGAVVVTGDATVAASSAISSSVDGAVPGDTQPRGTGTTSATETASTTSASTTTMPTPAGGASSNPPSSGELPSSGASSSSRSALPVGRVSIVLTGLNQDIRPGQTVPVTFVFLNAGTLVIQVPVGAPAGAGTAAPKATAER